jgi:hypothetical protein
MKTTIDMAREVYGAHTEWTGAPLDRLEQLVALVRADEREIEREACAMVCETYAPTTTPTWVSYAAAIRNRGNT